MLHVALKEWSIVCDLLTEGRLALLLRKGGIHEEHGPGEFRLEHPQFALWPSWEHQKPEMIKPDARPRVRIMPEPAQVTMRAMGEAVKIWEVPSREAFDRLDDLHPWTVAQIDMRFNYKPDHPLYLVAVRASVLRTPATIVNDWRYGGCRSWVPLKDSDFIDDAGATAVLDEDTMGRIIRRVDEAFAAV